MNVTIYVPILGTVPKDSVAGLAGLRAGDEIIAIEGRPTPSWDAVSLQMLAYMGEDKIVTLVVKDPAKTTPETKNLDIGQVADGDSESDWLINLGLTVADPVPPVVNKVMPDSPAFRAGLIENDYIESVDDKKINSRSELVHYIQTHSNKTVILEVLRGKQKLKITVVPMSKLVEGSDKEIGFIGIEFPPLKEIPKHFVRNQRYSVGEAFIKAVKRTAEYSVLTLEILKKMVVGKVSVRHISGPLAIAKYAGETAVIGFKQFLDFLAVISISLGVLNLLPIPILDGGHFMYCVYEFLMGRPVSEVAQMVGIWIGGVILVGFMMLAFYNDLSHLLL